MMSYSDQQGPGAKGRERQSAEAQGLYRQGKEHDACGLGVIASIQGKVTRALVEDALTILVNLEHRGAVGADPQAGDGAGIMIGMPDAFLRDEAQSLGFSLPALGAYGAGVFFLPKNESAQKEILGDMAEVFTAEGLDILGLRDVPVNSELLSHTVAPTEPAIKQVFVSAKDGSLEGDALERKLFITRRVLSGLVRGRKNPAFDDYYPVSLSCRRLIYKGMFLADQLRAFYSDLQNPALASNFAIVHQRFSTNTFPSWRLAHPYRMVAHNGEINTVRGNVNWMAARQNSMTCKNFGEDMRKLWPISYEGQSDTACFDNAFELLVLGGYSPAHAMMMMVPEAWDGNNLMDPLRKSFYEYNAAVMEPWDGPAAVVFSDGRHLGATLDRNGLRPSRYLITDDEYLVLASESGSLPIAEEKILEKRRLEPGCMLLLDLERGKLIDDQDIKAETASSRPYARWLADNQLFLETLDAPQKPLPELKAPALKLQQAFGYTQEDFKFLMKPMAESGQEAVGSMGTDTPIAVLSNKPQSLFNYFKQNFAQVTNPPIDPIREELVMSLVSFIGPRPNIFDLEDSKHAKRLEVRQPILLNIDLEKIREIEDHEGSDFHCETIDITYPASEGATGMAKALEAIGDQAVEAVGHKSNIIILSDRELSAGRVAIPSLLATSAVHHRLIREGLRTRAGLVVETGEAREIHHFCLLAGYGAEAINPYLAFDSLGQHLRLADDLSTPEEAVKRYIKAISKGIYKVMSKMGISTYQSYCGAQIFDAVGLNQGFIDAYFKGTHSSIEGVGLAEIAEETVARHRRAFGQDPLLEKSLDVGGEYAFRLRGEAHAWTPEVVAELQHAARLGSREKYLAFAEQVSTRDRQALFLRSLMRLKLAKEREAAPVSIEAVEPAENIVRRFVTGAMSFGSISREAHTTLAIAMNRIGGKSNTGEGGEETERFDALPNGDSMRSAIKQVASGRFGVTAEYLVNADQIQIKVAQGAKPGEGGQLPGHKVDAVIAKVRHSTPGVGLISPPPHHDIYSIEDLAQLIFDLKNVNPEAEGGISVKLVSEIGVGTVAAGVAKCRADHITISGYDGGTGASPLTSLKHAGSPWEIGLAETQQTLVLNGLRDRIVLQVDGGLRTGRDVVIGALLGADEFGFSTAPLIAAGCLMMRKCHLNTCPVGIATQDPVLRARFTGTPEHVINYFFLVAEEVREIMAALGVTRFEQLVGRSDWLGIDELLHSGKAGGVDFSRILYQGEVEDETKRRHSSAQKHPIDDVLDRELIAKAQPALEKGEKVSIRGMITNVDRSVGAMLSGQVARRYGHEGLEDETIDIKLEGTAGQSFGAFLAHGITLTLAGDANDYVGKGLSGGQLIVHPHPDAKKLARDSIIIGNTALYGATGGEAYFAGIAGERFAVRNSGAIAVAEGVGDHGCEYMTGGVVVVLGPTKRNFAAGMSGGIAYVLDENGDFAQYCNQPSAALTPLKEEEEASARRHHHRGDLEFQGLLDLKSDLTQFDLERLHQLVKRHEAFTGSEKAAALLANWDQAKLNFVKVMPVEYKQALEEMAEARVSAAE